MEIEVDTKKYQKYDEVVATVMANILVEKERCGKIILWDFNPENGADKLYYNVATIAADLGKENLYLDLSFWDYIKFWKKRRKKRRNLKRLKPSEKEKISEEYKTSVFVIMNYVEQQLDIPYAMFEKINNEYYGWIN